MPKEIAMDFPWIQDGKLSGLDTVRVIIDYPSYYAQIDNNNEYGVKTHYTDIYIRPLIFVSSGFMVLYPIFVFIHGLANNTLYISLPLLLMGIAGITGLRLAQYWRQHTDG